MDEKQGGHTWRHRMKFKGPGGTYTSSTWGLLHVSIYCSIYIWDYMGGQWIESCTYQVPGCTSKYDPVPMPLTSTNNRWTIHEGHCFLDRAVCRPLTQNWLLQMISWLISIICLLFEPATTEIELFCCT